MISLLLSFQVHREALIKILKEAHVEKDMTIDRFDGVVANITFSKCLGFNNEEIHV